MKIVSQIPFADEEDTDDLNSVRSQRTPMQDLVDLATDAEESRWEILSGFFLAKINYFSVTANNYFDRSTSVASTRRLRSPELATPAPEVVTRTPEVVTPAPKLVTSAEAKSTPEKPARGTSSRSSPKLVTTTTEEEEESGEWPRRIMVVHHVAAAGVTPEDGDKGAKRPRQKVLLGRCANYIMN